VYMTMPLSYAGLGQSIQPLEPSASRGDMCVSC